MKTGDLTSILLAGIDAVQPSKLLPRILSETPPETGLQPWLKADRRYLLTLGKAAVRSAEAVTQAVPCHDSFVLAPAGVPLGTLAESTVHFGSHPVPDARSIRATSALLGWIDSLPGDAQLLVVLSGGASALLVAPADGIPAEAKYELNRLLLRCGASISEMNAVRKHCSAVKGGALGRRIAGRPCRALLISDVIGDDPAVIGSGPFYPDTTTFLVARQVLERHNAWDSAPEPVRRRIELGVAGAVPETPKPGSLSIPHRVIASNEIARRAAGEAAAGLGYAARHVEDALQGDVTEAASRLQSLIEASPPGTALIAGGEVTVQLKGHGTGGRNQHLALLMTRAMSGRRFCFAAAGTDGIDGNSEAAGAWTDGETAQRAAALGLDPAAAAADFDSFPFFQALGQSILTGPTGTNVMDLYIALT